MKKQRGREVSEVRGEGESESRSVGLHGAIWIW
jgi:hypothetical protein